MQHAWSVLHAQFHALLKQQSLFPKESRILVAFSGGQDSLCLLKLLLDIQPKWGWTIATVYCDHRWPKDSGQNAAHVARVAKQWNVQHFEFIAPKVLKGEAEGRNWRYDIMATCAQSQDFPYLVTAHTASDRAETLLYHLIRGSGADGLQALSRQRSLNESVTLLRPILHLTRLQTGQFCQEQSLPVWEDGMNQDLHYRRNRIRLEVLPYVREHFNPQVDRAMAQTAELLQADVAYLEAQSRDAWEQVTESPDHSRLDRAKLAKFPLAIQRRVIRIFLLRHLPKAPTFAVIEKLVTLLNGNHRDRTDSLFRDVVAEVRHQWIVLHDLRDPSNFGANKNPKN